MKQPSSSLSPRVLEITVLSGENLRKSPKQYVKKNVFVTIKTDACNVQSTRIDKEGGAFPTWNEILIVDLPMHASYITVEVQCKNSSGITTIGIARVPTSDFIGGILPEDYLHFLSYRLRDVKGEKNGIINFSVKVKNAPQSTTGSTAAYFPSTTGCSADYSQQWKASASVAMGSNYDSCGVVTGIPVVYPSRSSYYSHS